MNGVFWLKSVTPIRPGRVRILNWHDVGKIKVDSVDTVVEDDLVYPLVRGRDVHRWVSTPSTHILLTQDPATRTGITPSTMRKKFRLTHEYLLQFESILRKRSGYVKYFDQKKDAFWTIYNVADYSVSPHRVLFKELTDFFQCAVADNTTKPPIADTKLRFIECATLEEAHFLCGLLNSSPAMLFLYTTATWVQTADYQASDISRLSLPRFASSNNLHTVISSCSKECHKVVAQGNRSELETLENQLDNAAAQLWNITDGELKAITTALSDFGLSPDYEDAEGTEDDDE
jgi:hypothetical protein